MPRNEEHSLLQKPTFAEASRQRFVLALKQDLGRRLRGQIREMVPNKVIESNDRELIEGHLKTMPERRIWGRLTRTAQELMWLSVAEPIMRNETEITERYQSCKHSSIAKGSLLLNEDVQYPEEIQKTDVHVQPGGYFLDRHEDDIVAGALYEAGGAIYSQGQSIDGNESKAELVIRFLKEKNPNFKPMKILDLACSAGASSTPYARHFPEAEIFAIDVAPGLLRYAHARANAMDLPVHFRQSDVANTGFENESFDLIVSHNAMHEMSKETVQSMMRESHRLLSKGGIVLHQDIPLRNSELDSYQQADYQWDQDYNNEPFWDVYADLDVVSLMMEAGFEARFDRVEQLGGSMNWDLFWAYK